LGASKTNVGFSVGGGMEGRFSYWLPPNWTWKLEYLYLDLGSVNTAGSFALVPPHTFLSNLTSTITTGVRRVHSQNFCDFLMKAVFILMGKCILVFRERINHAL
jgi:hypothetical protein